MSFFEGEKDPSSLQDSRKSEKVGIFQQEIEKKLFPPEAVSS